MLEKPPLSDSALIVGALFVAGVTASIGFFADPFAADRTVAMWNEAMLAATVPTQNSCLKPVANKTGVSGAVDFECLNGCTYVVETRWLSAGKPVNAYGTPNPQGPPGRQYYQALMGKPIGPVQCSGSVRQTAMNNFGDLRTNALGLEAGTSQAQLPASLGGSTASNVPLSSVINQASGQAYGWNNLPTQQGTYAWDAVPGGMISYTPGANGQQGTYDFWSATQFNEANAGVGGAAGAPANWVTAGDQSDWGDITPNTANINQFRNAGDDSTWGDINEYEQFNTAGDDPTWGDASAPSGVSAPSVASGNPCDGSSPCIMPPPISSVSGGVPPPTIPTSPSIAMNENIPLSESVIQPSAELGARGSIVGGSLPTAANDNVVVTGQAANDNSPVNTQAQQNNGRWWSGGGRGGGGSGGTKNVYCMVRGFSDPYNCIGGLLLK